MLAFARIILRQAIFESAGCEPLLLPRLQISAFCIFQEVTDRNKNLVLVQNF